MKQCSVGPARREQAALPHRPSLGSVSPARREQAALPHRPSLGSVSLTDLSEDACRLVTMFPFLTVPKAVAVEVEETKTHYKNKPLHPPAKMPFS